MKKQNVEIGYAKFWCMSLRFWCFLSYIITIVKKVRLILTWRIFFILVHKWTKKWLYNFVIPWTASARARSQKITKLSNLHKSQERHANDLFYTKKFQFLRNDNLLRVSRFHFLFWNHWHVHVKTILGLTVWSDEFK